MAGKINLLPVELGAGRKALQIGRVLGRISIVVVALSFVLGTTGVIYLFVLQRQVTNQVNKNNQLTSSIRNLEATEQKLVLLKDRVAKIKNILSQDSAYSNSESVKKIFFGLPTDVSLDEANLTPSQIRLTVTSKSSLGMVGFLNNLTSLGNFKEIVLKNFSFRPSSGYSSTVEAN